MPPRNSLRAPRETKKTGANKHQAAATTAQSANTPLMASNKRQRQADHDLDHSSKRVKTSKVINTAPKQRLQVLVFGSGESGELGLGAAEVDGRSPESAEMPRRNHNLDPKSVGVVQVAVGGMHCAALTYDGDILTWGVNDSNALSRDTTWKAPDELPDDMTDLNPLESTPAAVTGLDVVGSAIVQVAACDNATFVLTAAGDVYGWGTFFGNDGAYGFSKEKIQGSRKASSRQNLFQITPVRIVGLNDVKELATGVNHVLALTHSGDVYAWGSGHQFELGRRIVVRHESEVLVPRMVALPRKKVVKIFAGFNHNFAIDAQGLVWTWGLNNFGQTGLPTNEDNVHVRSPTVVEALRNYRIHTMAGGFHHSLACTEDGDVLVWGRCDDSQLGLDISTVPEDNVMRDERGRARVVSVPAKIPGLKAQFVAAGIDNSFAIDEAGNVLSWGFSENFRTGLRTEDSVEKPTLLRSKAMAGMKCTFVGCGGQFSVIAGVLTSNGVNA